jgi:hypothetical protein
MKGSETFMWIICHLCNRTEIAWYEFKNVTYAKTQEPQNHKKKIVGIIATWCLGLCKPIATWCLGLCKPIHTQFAHMFITHLCTKLHIPTSNGSLVTAIIPKAKEKCHTATKKLHVSLKIIVIHHMRIIYYMLLAMFQPYKPVQPSNYYYCI